MLFSPHLPYRFFPPRPNRLLAAAFWPYLRYRVLPRVFDVHSVATEGIDHLRQVQHNGDSQVIVINHPDHADGWAMGMALHQAGVRAHYLTAYANLVRASRLSVLAMRVMGTYSINRFDYDAASFRASMDILTGGGCRRAIVLTPEGNILTQGDRVAPFKEGGFFLAVRAARQLQRRGGSGRMWVSPVAVKFTHLTDARGEVGRVVDQLQRLVGQPPRPLGERPVATLAALGLAAANAQLQRLNMPDLPTIASLDDLRSAAAAILNRLETQLQLEPASHATHADRISQLQRHIHHQVNADRSPETLAPIETASHLAARLDSYSPDYTCQRTTLDRVSELARKLYEDIHNDRARLLAPMGAIIRAAPPLDVGQYLARGPIRQAIADLTHDARTAVQTQLDAINAANTAPGSRLWQTLCPVTSDRRHDCTAPVNLAAEG